MKKLLIAAITILSTHQLMSNDVSWSFPPTTISSGSVNASDPQIATDSSGDVVAAWVEAGQVKAATKVVNMSWSSASTISGINASSPRIASDSNGNATAVWLEGGIIKAAAKPFGGSWSASTSLSSSGASSPAIGVDGAGDVIAAWVRSGSVETSTKLFGGNWGSRTTITSSSATLPSVAVGGSGSSARGVIVWHGTSSGTTVVFSSTKLLSGTWSTQQVISDTSHQAAFAQVALDSNANATATWFRYDSSSSLFSNVALQSSSRPASGSWSAPMTLSENGLRDPATLMSRVAYDANGNAMALWTNSFNDATYTIQSAVRPVRQDWSEPVTLVNNSYTYGADLGVSALGDALALFMYGIGSALQIQSKESDISGFNNNVWSAPITLYSSAENGFPHVATTLTGNTLNAATVWLTNNGSINQVVASTGTRSIVLPPSSPTVSQSTNNFGVFTEYANTLSWTASTDPSVVGYLIYRNGEFLGQVSASTVQYVDHNRVQNGSVTYGVSAVNVQNSHSKIVNVNFP